MKLLDDLSGTIEEDGIIRDYPDSHHWVDDREVLDNWWTEWWKKMLYRLIAHISEHAFNENILLKYSRPGIF